VAGVLAGLTILFCKIIEFFVSLAVVLLQSADLCLREQ